MKEERPNMVTFAAVLLFITGGASLLFAIEALTKSDPFQESIMDFVGDGIVLLGILYLGIALVALYAGYVVRTGRFRGWFLGILVAAVHASVSFLFVLFLPLVTLIAVGLDLIVIYALISSEDYFAYDGASVPGATEDEKASAQERGVDVLGRG